MHHLSLNALGTNTVGKSLYRMRRKKLHLLCVYILHEKGLLTELITLLLPHRRFTIELNELYFYLRYKFVEMQWLGILHHV